MKNPPSKASRAWEALTPELSEWILTAVSSMGFEKMTPVQASTIPLFMENKDVVVEVSISQAVAFQNLCGRRQLLVVARP
jgi:superfamily II DNA/RNA helicase